MTAPRRSTWLGMSTRVGLGGALGTVTRVGLGGALGAVAYGVAVEREWFRLREVRIRGVLRSGRALRVLQVADLHLAPPEPGLRRFLDGLGDVGADLVVATGDLCGLPGSESATVELLTGLTRHGAPGIAVLGSSDLYGPVAKSPLSYFTDPDRRAHGPRLRTDVLVDGLTAAGWQVLRGARSTVAGPTGPIAVAGLDDPHLPETVHPPVTSLLLDEVPADDPIVLRLGLVHAPYVDAVDLLVDAGADLVLAGHTHGGQVRLPGVGALTANCDVPLRQARGVSAWRDGGARLHVTPGVGQSVWFPFRFACRPEATLLHLSV